ncbi:MAG: Holliday junction resolvase RuvX [bacterium]
MRILGIDYGSKRVGIALSDEAGHFAYPYSVIKNTNSLLREIKEICNKEGVKKIILGESLDYKGKDNVIMADIKIFKEALEREVEISVIYESEMMSTAEATRLQGYIDKIDASAAAIILKSYIDKNKA